MRKELLILFGMIMLFNFRYAVSCNNLKSYYHVQHEDEPSYRILDDSFGIDKNHIYYKGKIIKNINLETFEITWWGYDESNAVPGNICEKRTYIERFKDKNGEYAIEDISKGKLQLEE